MNDHLVFYDGECGLCDRSVQYLLKHDKAKLFSMAPLGGETFKKWPCLPMDNESVILIENYRTDHPKVHLYAPAVFRSLYLMGGWYQFIGWLYFLPPTLFNWAYKLIARNRKSLFDLDRCVAPLKEDRSRFLP